MIIAERLRQLRREKSMSKRQLVDTLPLNYSTYANYESGFREPNSEVLAMLSRHFGVSIDFLLGVTENRLRADEIAMLSNEEHEHIIKYRTLDTHGKEMVEMVLDKESERVSFPNPRVVTAGQRPDARYVVLPVYQQRASLGLGSYLSQENEGDYELIRFAATPVSERADFCVRITGDSMEPKIVDGDIVFVKATPKVDPESVGIFVYDGEAYCKRLRIDLKQGALYLDSLNKSFAPKPIALPENLRTVGLVIGIAE